VLRALRPTGVALDVIVAVSDGPSGPSDVDGADARGAARDEIRRSLELLAGDRVALARALSRPLAIDRLGVHRLGNLLLESLTSALGELTTASEWLGEQLGINGAVLPASDLPLRYETKAGPDGPRLRFVPESPTVSSVVLDVIADARWIVLTPGPPLEAVLPAAAIPMIAVALRRAPGRILWIDDHLGGSPHSPDELTLIRDHGVRVDAVLELPRASVRDEQGATVADPATADNDDQRRLREALGIPDRDRV
jgi:2-phospho-L-lactate transferase/gluconeogenesis factor (CofD/UPF0052 family)